MSNIEEKNVPSILYAYDMTMSHTHTHCQDSQEKLILFTITRKGCLKSFTLKPKLFGSVNL